MADLAIAVTGLGKRYRLGPRAPVGGSLQERIGGWLAPGRRAGRQTWGGGEFWALSDISFGVPAGQIVGIIGRNGAGKSTLLKILARITDPTAGRALIRGRVGSLLEVGTGFHPELSGRENIHLNGAILGMPRRELRRKFDEIVSFAEVERFLDLPVKRYSSGMYVRLAFAVAAHLEPEILLVDEVLAVGDLAFQQKCLGKMGDVARAGRTVLFVSHNLAPVQRLCQRGLVLEGGRLAHDGPVADALAHYLRAVQPAPAAALRARRDRAGDGTLRFTAVRFATTGGPAGTFLTGEDFRAELDYEAAGPQRHVCISVPFFAEPGQPAFMAWTRVLNADFARLPAHGTIVLEIPRLPLRAGTYTLNLHAEVGGRMADWVREAARFQVADGDYYGTGHLPPPGYGLVVVDHRFHLAAPPTADAELGRGPAAARGQGAAGLTSTALPAGGSPRATRGSP